MHHFLLDSVMSLSACDIIVQQKVFPFSYKKIRRANISCLGLLKMKKQRILQ